MIQIFNGTPINLGLKPLLSWRLRTPPSLTQPERAIEFLPIWNYIDHQGEHETFEGMKLDDDN